MALSILSGRSRPSGPPACLAEDPTVGSACGVPGLRNGVRVWAGAWLRAEGEKAGWTTRRGSSCLGAPNLWGQGQEGRRLGNRRTSQKHTGVPVLLWKAAGPRGQLRARSRPT